MPKIALLIVISVFYYACEVNNPGSGDETPKIAVYSGFGSWNLSVGYAKSAAEQTGLRVELLDVPAILEYELDDYYLFIIPGGDPREITNELGPVGRTRIMNFVNSGGGYIGLGAGAVVAAGDWQSWRGVGLLDGAANWPVNQIAPYPELTMTTIRRATVDHPIADEGESHYSTLYRWGPEFVDFDPLVVRVIYQYEATGSAAAVAFKKNAGRVFLAGFQPEIEEGEAADSSGELSGVYDPDSEWDIIERAVRYCLWEI